MLVFAEKEQKLSQLDIKLLFVDSYKESKSSETIESLAISVETDEYEDSNLRMVTIFTIACLAASLFDFGRTYNSNLLELISFLLSWYTKEIKAILNLNQF